MKDYLFNFVNKGTSVLAGLFVSVALARFLGVELRGELAFITQVSSIIAIILGVGMGHDFIRRYKLSPRRGTYERTIAVFGAHFLVLAIAALIVFGILGSRTGAYVAGLSVVLGAYQQLEAIMSAYNIRLKMRVNLLYSAIRVLSHTGMIFFAPTRIDIPVAIAAGNALLVVVVYLVTSGRRRLRRPAWKRARSIYSFGWIPMLSTLLVVLNYSIDAVMLKPLGTAYDLGIYSVAAGVVTYLWVLPDAIKEVLISRIVKASGLHSVLLPLKLAVAAGAACVLGILAVGWFLIPLLFGADFADSYYVLAVLSVGVVPMVYYKILGVVVLAEGRRLFYFVSLFVSVLLNVALNLVAIPYFGAMGAAAVSALSYMFTGSAFLVYYARIADLSIIRILFLDRSELQYILQILHLRGPLRGGE